MESFTTTPKPEHGSAEWLAARWKDDQGRALISASVAAAIHDEHTYTSSGDLAAELLAPNPPEPKSANQAMQRGTRMEPFIREWAEEEYGIKITEPRVMYKYDDEGVRLIATLDGMTEDYTPVEIKTTARRWDGKLPRYWYWQGVQQAICANSASVEWVIFDSSLQMYRHTQQVSSDEKRVHIEACREFLRDIDAGIMPFGAMIKAEHAQQMHPKSDGSIAFLDSQGAELVSELKSVREHIKGLEEIESELKGRVGLLLGDAQIGLYEDSEVVTWKNMNRTVFDTKRFEKEHPALAAKFRKETTTRVMRLKGDKQ